MSRAEQSFWDKVDLEFTDCGPWREVVGSDAAHLDEYGPVTLPDGTEHKEIDGVWYRKEPHRAA